ncbi:MAG TPA: murein biosynthesis integral membrane protein MurJ [Gemmatimonadales bacterium]|nr:murein biosynthesis integral membrane protein MurJ [Gemmatimonadales bacterium]
MKSPLRGGAPLVAAGIVLSRLAGLVRQRVLSHYLGLSLPADAFNQAFRIPNFLQNLFGEGVLSASFIPAYSRLRAEGRDQEARSLAGAVLGILFLVLAVLVALGITAAPWLVTVLAPGFEGPKRELTIQLVRVLFPGVGLLVLSAWCLSILNSHRKFFLSYAAPVLWNLAIIAATIAAPQGPLEGVVLWVAWGAVAGGALQLLVQLPSVLSLVPGLRPGLGRANPNVRSVLGNFFPAFVTRGVTQISAFVDGILASLLPGGAVTAMANAQVLYTLPVSLFGMSIAAAELPELAAAAVAGEAGPRLRSRLEDGRRRVAFFVVPTVVAFLLLGEIIAALFFQTGRFTAEDARYVWMILGGSAIGLLASTQGRLYNSVYFALHDTRAPLRFATIRVALSIMLGYFAAVHLPRLLDVNPRWGAAGITAAAGISAWVEFILLQRGLVSRLGPEPRRAGYSLRLWGAALLAGATAWLALTLAGRRFGPELRALMVLIPFGLVYLLATALAGIPLARRLIGRGAGAP